MKTITVQVFVQFLKAERLDVRDVEKRESLTDYTVWKIDDFSVTQILRENNLEVLKMPFLHF